MEDYTVKISRTQKCGVLVAGGGVGGVSAAISASRTGADVMLIESGGCLGGQAGFGIVTPVGSIETISRKSFGGLCREIYDNVSRLTKKYASPKEGFEDLKASPHILKYVLLKTAVEAGVNVRFHTQFIDAECENGKIKSVIVSDKNGFMKISADMFIDATGDGDLIVKSGADYVKGSEKGVYHQLAEEGMDKRHFTDEKMDGGEKSGLMQPVSIFFTMENVDMKKAFEYNNKVYKFGDFGITKEKFKKWEFAGTCGFEITDEKIPLPQGRILVSFGTSNHTAVINMSRVTGIDGTDADSLNDGEIKAQLQVIAIVDFLKTFIPGFENSYLVQSASSLGVRETRRLKGNYVLSGLEAIKAEQNDERIARGSYIIDIHDPNGRKSAFGGDIKGDFYDIPYGTLVTDKVENLLVCGRCISVDHVANSSTRVQGTCIMTGQAAGTAAALAVKENISAPRVDVKKLQKILIDNGVYLD